ncbi:MAG: hypothetical protein JSS66_13205 [Armatimonadetes bacterium]|nr:hypothetical protein [Armatimonadota bacterium]
MAKRVIASFALFGSAALLAILAFVATGPGMVRTVLLAASGLDLLIGVLVLLFVGFG